MPSGLLSPKNCRNRKAWVVLSSALVHVYGMHHLTLVILIALAPLSWGNAALEFYCEREAVHERLYTESVESPGWRKNDVVFEPNERSQFLVNVDSQSIEVVEHPFFGDLGFVTKKFSRLDHVTGLNVVSVEGLTYGSMPFAFRLSGFEENGTFPYMLARSGFSQQPFLNYDVGTCAKQ